MKLSDACKCTFQLRHIIKMIKSISNLLHLINYIHIKTSI